VATVRHISLMQREDPEAARRRRATASLRGLGSAALALGFAVAVLMVGASLLGYQRYIITGKSMTGSIPVGSVVYDRVVPTSSLKVGDIITYDPPASARFAPTGNVTHRIAWIGKDAKGRPGFQTKGDANDGVDPWKFALGEHQAKVVFHVPYLGYVLAKISEPRFRMILIGVPALLLALAVLAGMWKEAGEELERERREAVL
jgi:signal peptidase